MIETQKVIKPESELTQTDTIVFHWSAFPNLKVSLNLVQRVMSMGIWHAKGPLSRIQNPSQLQGGCPRAVPDLWRPGADDKGKRFSMRYWVERSQEGEPLSHQNTKEKEWENIQNSFGTYWICGAAELQMGCAFWRLGGQERLFRSHRNWVSPQQRDRNHKHPSHSTNQMLASRHISIFMT